MTKVMLKMVQDIIHHVPERESISIEAAHIYSDQNFDKINHGLSAKVAQEISSSLASHNRKVVNQLFIDDFNVKEKNIDCQVPFFIKRRNPKCLNKRGQEYLFFIKKFGFAPEEIIWESEFFKQSKKQIKKWMKLGLVKSPAKNWTEHDIYFGNKEKKILLWLGKEQRPTCALLDTLRIAKELKKNAATISVLHISFTKHTAKVMSLLPEVDNSGGGYLSLVFFSDQGIVKYQNFFL